MCQVQSVHSPYRCTNTQYNTVMAGLSVYLRLCVSTFTHCAHDKEEVRKNLQSHSNIAAPHRFKSATLKKKKGFSSAKLLSWHLFSCGKQCYSTEFLQNTVVPQLDFLKPRPKQLHRFKMHWYTQNGFCLLLTAVKMIKVKERKQ